MHTFLDALASGSLATFHGVPAGTRVTDLAPDFSAEAGRWGQGTLGREQRTARFIVQELATGRPLRIWFDAAERVLLADVEYPGLPYPPAEVMAQLGEPEAQIGAEDDLFSQLTERVFARRGLSLISDPTDRFLTRIIAFPATTVDDYLERLRLNP